MELQGILFTPRLRVQDSTLTAGVETPSYRDATSVLVPNVKFLLICRGT